MSEKSYPASNCTHKDTVIKVVIRDVHPHDMKIMFYSADPKVLTSTLSLAVVLYTFCSADALSAVSILHCSCCHSYTFPTLQQQSIEKLLRLKTKKKISHIYFFMFNYIPETLCFRRYEKHLSGMKRWQQGHQMDAARCKGQKPYHRAQKFLIW